MCPVIFHIDVNSAYLSWSAVHMLSQGCPYDLRTIDSAVGGDTSSRHGVILAKSIPAKRYHIRTGEPVTDALKKCPHLLLIPPDRELYLRFSRRMRRILSEYSDDIRPYSIDECFMVYRPVPGDGGSCVAAAHIIRKRIFKELGFTVNVGISTNYLLAKMASDFEKPDRVHTLFPEEIPEKMWPLPVGDLFMVGRSAASRLELLGIRTIGDLAHTDPAILYSHLKSHGQTLWEYANGIEKTPIGSGPRPAKGIGHSTTLSADITTVSEASKVLSELAQKVSDRLKKAALYAGMVSVEIKYSDFRSFSHQKQLPEVAQDASRLHRAGMELFNELWTGEPIRLLGLRTSRLSDEPIHQMSLFEAETDMRHQKLDKAFDAIRKKYGDGAIIKASSLPSSDNGKRDG